MAADVTITGINLDINISILGFLYSNFMAKSTLIKNIESFVEVLKIGTVLYRLECICKQSSSSVRLVNKLTKLSNIKVSFGQHMAWDMLYQTEHNRFKYQGLGSIDIM